MSETNEEAIAEAEDLIAKLEAFTQKSQNGNLTPEELAEGSALISRATKRLREHQARKDNSE